MGRRALSLLAGVALLTTMAVPTSVTAQAPVEYYVGSYANAALTVTSSKDCKALDKEFQTDPQGFLDSATLKELQKSYSIEWLQSNECRLVGPDGPIVPGV